MGKSNDNLYMAGGVILVALVALFILKPNIKIPELKLGYKNYKKEGFQTVADVKLARAKAGANEAFANMRVGKSKEGFQTMPTMNTSNIIAANPIPMNTNRPTTMPTTMPSYMPTSMPTYMPTTMPTSMPTSMPTTMPPTMPPFMPAAAMSTTMPPTTTPLVIKPTSPHEMKMKSSMADKSNSSNSDIAPVPINYTISIVILFILIIFLLSFMYIPKNN